MSNVYKMTAMTHLPRTLSVYEREALEEMRGETSKAGEDLTPEMVLAAARDEAEQKVRAAHAEGMRRGEEAGETKFREAVAESAAALEAAARAMHDARERFLDGLEPQVLELAVAIAGQIVQREVETGRDVVRATVRRALTHLLDRETMVVRVNPADLDAMRNERITLLEEFEEVRQIVVQADDTVDPGGCIVESELMQVDARMSVQLDTIMQILRDSSDASGEV
ncbi:MAG: hypothetical protein GWP08_09585 [Nitrospiraceae bacterium]|nr:hypothetical protein [Nitrospiraceae bacterium]